MANYEKAVRPVHNASTPVVVQLGITLTQIFDVVSPKVHQSIIPSVHASISPWAPSVHRSLSVRGFMSLCVHKNMSL